VPQGRGLFAGMTVAENLALGRLARATDGSHGVAWSEEKIYQYFPRLKERMHVAADYLSGGEQQMAAVARALSGNVKLLLLDEPFEGLAPAVVQPSQKLRTMPFLNPQSGPIMIEGAEKGDVVAVYIESMLPRGAQSARHLLPDSTLRRADRYGIYGNA
jgi:ABC-type branched-subunit amino acid transport system ATPase component